MVNPLISQNQRVIMKARWADPVYAARQSASLRKPPCCPNCGETDIANFYTDEKGLRTNKVCKECHKQVGKKRWLSLGWLDKIEIKAKKYNVTKEVLVELHEKQGGKCAICGDEPTTKRGLHIDHCHQTGAIRGLLCHGCNTGIGAMKDSADIVSKALSYLRG